MSTQTIKLVIAGLLFLHGIAHLGALAALLVNRAGGNTDGWLPARSWLSPSLAPGASTTVASAFWVLSAVGFVAAALFFWGLLVPGELWRQLAVASSCRVGHRHCLLPWHMAGVHHNRRPRREHRRSGGSGRAPLAPN